MPILVLLVISGILIYWLWPLFLAAGATSLLLLVVNKKRYASNLQQATKVIPFLNNIYKETYCIQEENPIKFIRINEITIRNRKLWSEIVLSFTAIYWDDSWSDDYYYYKFTDFSDEFMVRKVNSSLVPGGITEDLIREDVNNLLQRKTIALVPNDSIELKLCKLMFMNLPEAQWASRSISEINAALEPVAATYNASLRNELLASNTEFLLKAMQQLHSESEKLSEYVKDACEAMRKAYEYISVPQALRAFNDLDITPLEIFAKSEEMRDGFNSALAIKNEYDSLRGR